MNPATGSERFAGNRRIHGASFLLVSLFAASAPDIAFGQSLTLDVGDDSLILRAAQIFALK